LFFNTNHLPKANDDTIFSSGRVKLIPFDRHFSKEEQDTGLKVLFRQRENMSGILNWLTEGYRLLKDEGLSIPPRIEQAVANYRMETDIIGDFFHESLTVSDGNRLQTAAIYPRYVTWAKDNGYRPLNNKSFVGELRKRYNLRRDGKRGNEILDVTFS
jgi:putative DNA primase/helicase